MGAAIILIANGTLPDIFASITRNLHPDVVGEAALNELFYIQPNRSRGEGYDNNALDYRVRLENLE